MRPLLVAAGLVSGSGARLLRKERVSDLATALSHVRLWRDFADSPRAGQHDSLLVLEVRISLTNEADSSDFWPVSGAFGLTNWRF